MRRKPSDRVKRCLTKRHTKRVHMKIFCPPPGIGTRFEQIAGHIIGSLRTSWAPVDAHWALSAQDRTTLAPTDFRHVLKTVLLSCHKLKEYRPVVLLSGCARSVGVEGCCTLHLHATCDTMHGVGHDVA